MKEENNLEILIVEDSPTQALQLQHVLEKAGFGVTAAVNGKEALSLLEGGVRPALVISDIVMPEMNGYELCKRLRADERFKRLPVILVTALSDPKDVIKGLECGADNFIVKPYDEKYILNRIRYLFANFELRKSAKAEMGINVFFSGENYFITSERLQILDLLLSTYENSYCQNQELISAQKELRELNERLEELVSQRTAELIDANKRLQLELGERKQAEKELERLKRQYELILHSAGEGIIGQDLKGRFTFVNPSAENMLGYKAEELIGKPSHAMWHHSMIDGAPYPEEECPIMQACKDCKACSGIDEVFWRKDGTSFPGEYTATPMREGDAVTGMVVIFRDITHVKRIQEAEFARIAADTSNKAKSDFLANMSHELRTPLNSILGFSEVLQDELVGTLNDKQKEFAKDIYSSGKHLLDLINDILDLAKVESGKMELELSRFLLKDVLSLSINMFKEKAMKHNIKMDLETGPGTDIAIEADERKLKQIMYNLLSNAVKFTPDGGSVRVSARKGARAQGSEIGKGKLAPEPRPLVSDGDFLEISVTDTGIGIKNEDMPKLFKEFTQLESIYTRQYAGTGLGLALTKKLVELHGGKIWVESEFGMGSKFTFLIPVRQ